MSIAEKLTTVAENVPKVYEAGQEVKNRAWWDVVTANNTKTGYTYGFAYMDFSHVGGFNPPYKITAKGYSTNMFERVTGIDKITAEQLDVSQCTTLQYMFNSAGIGEIELIDTRGATNLSAMLNENSATHTVGKIILKSDGSQTISNSSFYSAYGLKNITFEGVIGQNIWFNYCGGLTKASIISIVNALSSTTSGKTLTLPTKAVTNAFGSTTAAEWTALVGTKTNWTISLV